MYSMGRSSLIDCSVSSKSFKCSFTAARKEVGGSDRSKFSAISAVSIPNDGVWCAQVFVGVRPILMLSSLAESLLSLLGCEVSDIFGGRYRCDVAILANVYIQLPLGNSSGCTGKGCHVNGEYDVRGTVGMRRTMGRPTNGDGEPSTYRSELKFTPTWKDVGIGWQLPYMRDAIGTAISQEQC